MPDRVWYYSTGGGHQQGPIHTAQLKRLAMAGELRPGDLVWSDGMANWAPASTVKGLFPAEQVTGAIAAEDAAVAGGEAAGRGAAGVDDQAGPHARPLAAATELASTASRQALAAFKSLLSDPVGGMGAAFGQLSSAAVLQVGVAFLVVFVLLVLGAILISGSLIPGMAVVTGVGLIAMLRDVTTVLAIAAAMIGVVAVFRNIGKSAAGYRSDLFIVGASLLPPGFAWLLGSVLNINSRVVAAVVMAVMMFAMTFLVLMLYSGIVQITRLSERLASMAVATALVAAGASAGLVFWLFALATSTP